MRLPDELERLAEAAGDAEAWRDAARWVSTRRDVNFDGRTLRIDPDRRRLVRRALFLVLMLLMVGFGGWLAVRDRALLGIVVAIGSLPLLALAVFWLRQLRGVDATLTIDDSGLQFGRGLAWRGALRWDEVASLFYGSPTSPRHVAIVPRDPERITRDVSRWWRLNYAIARWFPWPRGWPAVSLIVDAATLPVTAEELTLLITCHPNATRLREEEP